MPKPPKTTEEDDVEFRTAMRGIKPLKNTKIAPHVTRPTPSRRRKPLDDPDEATNTIFEFSDYENLPLVDSNEAIRFARTGIQHKKLRKLHQGQYNIEAILDLHGMTVADAREALGRFLLRCQDMNLQHVLIIHGKGRGSNKPILKNKLNHWLRQVSHVVAFCSATAKHGQQGAMYVLLRRTSFGK